MPVSGGDVGINAWVEKDELMVYLGRAGYRDENGAITFGPVGEGIGLLPAGSVGFTEVAKLRGTPRKPDLSGITSFEREAIENTCAIRAKVTLVEPRTIQRSEGKAKRVIDKREE